MSYLARAVEVEHLDEYEIRFIQPLWGSRVHLVSSTFDIDSECFIFTWSVQPAYSQTIPQITPKPNPIYWREYFGVENGVIRLIKIVIGEYTPATETPASVEWEE
jgi:hypothetical protein